MRLPPDDQDLEYAEVADEWPSEPRRRSLASLVLGIVSVVFGFTFFLPLVGVVLGVSGARTEPAGRGIAIAGIIVNLVCMAFWIVIILMLVLGLIAFTALSSTAAGPLAPGM